MVGSTPGRAVEEGATFLFAVEDGLTVTVGVCPVRGPGPNMNAPSGVKATASTTLAMIRSEIAASNRGKRLDLRCLGDGAPILAPAAGAAQFCPRGVMGPALGGCPGLLIGPGYVRACANCSC